MCVCMCLLLRPYYFLLSVTPGGSKLSACHSWMLKRMGPRLDGLGFREMGKTQLRYEGL